MGRTCSTYGTVQKCIQSFMGISDRKRSLGRPRRSWKDTIIMDLMRMGCDSRNTVDPAEYRDQWRTYVSAIILIDILHTKSYFLQSSKNDINFPSYF